MSIPYRLVPLLAALLATTSPPAPLELMGSAEIAPGTVFRDVVIGGLSGLDRLRDGSYISISDDRGAAGRPPRLYRMTIRPGGPTGLRIGISDQIVLRATDGTALPTDRATVDPEAVRGAGDGRLYWSSEGVWSADPAALVQPAMIEADANGRTLRRFAVPDNLLYQDGRTHGARPNGVFEGLAPDSHGRLFAVTEAPSFDDVPVDAPSNAPALLRLTRFSRRTGAAEAQYAVIVPDRRYGITDLIADGPDFLVVERATPFDARRGASVNIVRLRIPQNATDVLHHSRLVDGAVVPVVRELLLNLADLKPTLRIDNIEGIAHGPMLHDGRRSIVLISDDNFNAQQITQVLLIARNRR